MESISCSLLWALIPIVAIGCAASATAQGQDEAPIVKSFQVGPGGRLTLETERGSIEVHAADTRTLEVTVTRKVDVRDPEKADRIREGFQVEFDQRGNDVHISGKAPGGKGFWKAEGKRLQLQYLITVPKSYNVDLSTSGGGISVDGLEGEVHSRTSGGSLRFGHIHGPVQGRTSGGSITLEGCTDSADVRTSGGSIRIGEVGGAVDARTSGGSIRIAKSGGHVVARTSGGSIKVEDALGDIDARTSGGSVTARISNQPKGDCRLETSGGSITVSLADTVRVDVDARTSGGRVVTDFPVTIQGKLRKNALKAKVNGGGPKLILHTSGGSIYLRKL